MQLLKITSVPLKLEMRVERPRLEMKSHKPSVEISQRPARLRMQAQNTRVQINTDKMRYSMGRKDVFDRTADAAHKGRADALEATAQYTEIGNQMAKIHQGANIPDILYSSFYRGYATQMAFIPSEAPEMNWQPATLDIQYDPAQLNMDWSVQQNVLEYHPGDFSVEIVQYPRIDIEYLGGFMYVPPSSEPGYEEPEP